VGSRRERRGVSHKREAVATAGDLSTEFVHNHVDRRGARAQTLSPGKGLRHDERDFATDALQSIAAFSMVPVTQLRPAFLLR
jgi:hypothetical protein